MHGDDITCGTHPPACPRDSVVRPPRPSNSAQKSLSSSSPPAPPPAAPGRSWRPSKAHCHDSSPNKQITTISKPRPCRQKRLLSEKGSSKKRTHRQRAVLLALERFLGLLAGRLGLPLRLSRELVRYAPLVLGVLGEVGVGLAFLVAVALVGQGLRVIALSEECVG